MDAGLILFLIYWTVIGLIAAVAFGYAVQDRRDKDDVPGDES